MNKCAVALIFSYSCFLGQTAQGLKLVIRNSYTEPIKVHRFEVNGDPADGVSETIIPGEPLTLVDLDPARNEIWVVPVSRHRIKNRGHYAKISLRDLRMGHTIKVTGFNFADGCREAYYRESLVRGAVAKFAAITGFGAKLRPIEAVIAELSYSDIASEAMRREGAIDVEKYMRFGRLDEEQFSILYDIAELKKAYIAAGKLGKKGGNRRYRPRLIELRETCRNAARRRKEEAKKEAE